MSNGQWTGSTRLDTLPHDWPMRRRAVFERDERRCQIRGPGCTYLATEVDHCGARNDHRLEALRSACATCHQHRSSSQGGQARAAKGKRPPERHPGLTW